MINFSWGVLHITHMLPSWKQHHVWSPHHSHYEYTSLLSHHSQEWTKHSVKTSHFWENLLWRALQLSCPYKAWKPQLVDTYLWHSPCKRGYVTSTASVAVECHSMWKHPEHLIIKLIKPAHKIRCCRDWNLHTSSATRPCLVSTGPQKINIKHRQALVYSDDGVWGWAMKQAWEAKLATALYWCESVIHWVAHYTVRQGWGGCHCCSACESHTSEAVKLWLS